MCFLVSAHNTYFKAKVPLICNCNLYQPVEAQHKTRDKNAEDADRTMCDFSCVLFPRLVGFHTSLCTNSSKPLLCCNSYAFMCLVGWLQQHLPCLCCTFVVKPINGFMISEQQRADPELRSLFDFLQGHTTVVPKAFARGLSSFCLRSNVLYKRNFASSGSNYLLVVPSTKCNMAAEPMTNDG